MRACIISNIKGIEQPMPKKTFRRICLANLKDTVEDIVAGESRPVPKTEECRGCFTGLLVAAGVDFDSPEGIGFIEDVDYTKRSNNTESSEGEKTMENQSSIINYRPADDIWKEIPLDVLEGVTRENLRAHLKYEPIKANKRGTCPVCRRPHVLSAAYGICSRCGYQGKGKMGVALLDALTGKPTLRKSGRKRKKTAALPPKTTKASTPKPAAGDKKLQGEGGGVVISKELLRLANEKLQEEHDAVVNQFVLPLANMAAGSWNKVNIVDLCKKAREHMEG